MVAWLKALLFVAGGVIAAAGTAYVTGLLDPWIDRPAVIASLPEGEAAPSENGGGANAGADAKQDKPVVDNSTVPGDPSTTDKQSRLIAPSFDVVRVEPDGSLLIAGEAAAGSTVEVLSGDSVLGSGSSGEAGDFVIVLDEPLKPGDYQIALRTTTDGAAAMSTQTALVSVPDSPDGEVLALVEEPGEPSRLITKPEGETVAAPDVPAMPDGDRMAMEGSAGGGDDAGQPETGSDAASADPDEPEQDTAGNEVAQDEPLEEQADAATPDDGSQTPGESLAQADDADAPAGDDGVSAGDGDAEIASGEPAADQPSEQEIAGLPATGDPDAAEEQPADTPSVLVEAVEIEGDTVFVAGQADPGSNVRIYANDIHLGDARASDGGRFLVEAQRDLPVGDYVIRADVLAPDGTVLARAAVPFEREPGESIAAVAVQPGSERSDASGEQAEAAPGGSPASPDDGEAPTVTADDAAPDGSAGSDAPAMSATEPPPPGNGEAASPAANEDAVASGEGPADGAGDADAGRSPVDGAADVASAASGDKASEDGLTAPRLQRVDGAVIIRRGDTLWRISRRVYGQGIRYSTIYLANQDQISDPDRIWPGQVFGVPEETADGVTADMKAIGEQAVPADTESRIIR